MSFFKKKRFSDVEGYDRISRLIEDRQRGDSEGEDEDEGDAGDLSADTVLLSPQARTLREPVSESVSIVRPSEAREPAPSAPLPSFTRPEVSVTQPASPYAPSTPTPVQAQAPAPPPTPPRMKLPDVPALTGGASLVSKDAIWDGKLACTGDVRIEGTLQGEVETSGTLFVAEGARVHGTVRARNVLLAGEIDGQMRCDEKLEILPGGSARGEIDTGSLVVHEGAFIESKFQMRHGAAPAGRL